MEELIFSIGFDVVAMGLTACYIGRLLLEELFPPRALLSGTSEAVIEKPSLLGQRATFFRRIRM